MISYISTFLAASVCSLLITFPIVWLLRIFKLGQPVRDEGPAAHLAKTGTPTMGGVGFLLVILALIHILVNVELRPEYLALFFLILAFAAIGLADDLLKILRGKNLGLTFWQKIVLQAAAAGGFAVWLTLIGHNLNYHGILYKLGLYNCYVYPLLLTFIIVGAANATNLTDGLNGLLAGTGGLAFLSLAIVAINLRSVESATVSLVIAGALFAFLYFNFPRAQVFMGDVGSLALGAALAGLAIILHKELLLVLIGGVFVIEALSVILQVFSYKLFKRRIFKMAPLHHHFELMGIKEAGVVVGFWVVGGLLGVLGVLVPWW